MITAERLRKLLTYDPETGLFHWRVKRGRNNAMKPGDVAGYQTEKGYIRIRVEGRLYMAHRLAWLYVKGEWPPGEIDHYLGVKNDNRWASLRLVDRYLNNQNRRAPNRNNKTGLLGVSPKKRKGGSLSYAASMRIDGSQSHLGYFPSPELAHAAYLKAKRQHHEGNTL